VLAAEEEQERQEKLQELHLQMKRRNYKRVKPTLEYLFVLYQGVVSYSLLYFFVLGWVD